ncbi:MAG: polyphosphate kinase 1 [Lentisphaerae bacterium]|jgi:polyphosphate kinase|nr:polyphosphate kinase 1 [Lentisphaerota bacterium]MBT4815133.1 polyphosphate kinase 1 [Lentisphaerota bacterium]MBT5608789.1 polyphosphate kinase 1 [Lentisphaerota bacterium]MBT7058300.1 polyphosphate kinase 1 [Lentisphaerota bacterium]MBT7840275.1 polyphosphate kinase 1 [Lentisphaerota bacterium]
MDAKYANYINRELSWLEFNHRVLEEGMDPTVPLLERLKFLAITDSNLNEFFMVRVGGLRLLADQGVVRRDATGLSPAEQLELIHRRTHRMVEDAQDIYLREVEPRLAATGVQRTRPNELTDVQIRYLGQLFDQETAAVVTPMAVRSVRQFPLLKGLALHLAVRLRPQEGTRRTRIAVMPLGAVLDRFITLPGRAGLQYVLLEDVVLLFIDRLFPGERVAESVVFRITRNADMSVEEDGVADLLSGMQAVLNARKSSGCVRLEIQRGVSRTMLSFLQRALHVSEDETYCLAGPLDLAAFMELATMEGFPGQKYPEWVPQASPLVDPKSSMFDVLARQDVLLSHPFDTFKPVLRLIDEAADDPDVLAIKQTLYRTSRKSPVIEALKRAAANGKYVTVAVELKARFDEARNIGWAKKLEEEGVQVIYGVKGLKTHSKILVIVRRESRGIVRYMHFGTGNYNEATARLYCDISYLTSDADLGADASSFFNAICGFSAPQQLLKLAVAPIGLREKIVELIEDETERSRQGQEGTIRAKMNSLADETIINALYRASQAGVQVFLNVRGICCLRPGIAGLSENIRVTSIVDRFLEHSRLFYFRHGGEERVYISSADWMPRNLDRRVELLVPIDDDASRKELIRVLGVYSADTVKARILLPDGRYERVQPDPGAASVRSQQALYTSSCERIAHMQQARRTAFEPHLPADTQE